MAAPRRSQETAYAYTVCPLDMVTSVLNLILSRLTGIPAYLFSNAVGEFARRFKLNNRRV